MDMAEVKAFNAELSGLYDNKPPISKAKMSAITRGAIKAIKFYKHVVHSVEKFIQKCKPEYKVPGLYVIDSIVRQSRHQFGQDKDVFAPRFAKNMQQTFANLFRCPPEDKRNIIRVLNLWQKNNVFGSEVIQPLLDMADPNHPLHKEIEQQNSTANGSSLNVSHNTSDNKISPVPPPQHTPHTSTPAGEQFQDQSSGASGVKFNRKLLNDFEYESEDDRDDRSTGHEPLPPVVSAPSQPQQNPADALGSILTNPEIMRQLQSLQAQMQMMAGMQMPNLQNLMPMMSDMQLQQNQNQNLPFLNSQQDAQKQSEPKDDIANESDIEFVETGPQVIEIPDANDSRSPSPKSRRHRSRSKSPKRRRRSRTRSRSPRRRRDRDRDRDRDRERDKDREKSYKEREAEKEKQREREKKGLPPIKKENLSVCSTTLWVGHLSKLATPEELSDLFGAMGGVVSIDVVAPRGCAFVVMERRRDAAKALAKLNKHKLHSKEITVAWAPGKGVKGREWKDYWEAEQGVSYLPWAALHARWSLAALSLDALEDGGAVDEDTLPPWLPTRIMPKFEGMPMVGGAGVGVPSLASLPLPPHPAHPAHPAHAPHPAHPAHPAHAGLPAHPGLPVPVPVPAMPPPGMTPGMPPGLAPGMPPGIRAPTLPARVPGLQGEAGIPPTGALLGFPPGLPPQPMSQQGMVGGFLGGLLGVGVGVGVGGLVGGMPLPLPHAHVTPPPTTAAVAQTTRPTEVTHTDDAMDLDTEEHTEETTNEVKTDNDAPPALLPYQIQALLSKPPPAFNKSEPPPGFNASEPPPFDASQPPPAPAAGSAPASAEKTEEDRGKDRDRERKDRDRDRDRDRRDRDRRDRDRRDRGDRDRTRDRDRERDDRRDRDRDRGRDRRDRDRDNRDTRDSRDNRENRDNRDNRDRDRDRFSSRDNSDRGRDKSPRNQPNIEQGSEKSLQERLWEMANGKPANRSEEKPRDDYQENRDNRDNVEETRIEDGPRIDRPPPALDRIPVMHDHQQIIEGEIDKQADMESGWTQLATPRHPPAHGMAPPFRAELRMRGPPRQPMRGQWMEGPGPAPGPGPGPFGPRFNGMGPPFNRPPFERPPFEGPGPMFDGPPRFERPPFNCMPFDGPNRPPFDGPRPPFDAPRPPFDGPRPFDGPPPFEGERPYDAPPRFEGPPEYFDRNNRRFDDREPYNERGWNGDRDRDREWDRRNEWDDRRRDRRSRDHDQDRFRDRNERRRNFDERPRNPRDERNDRNSRKERDRKSRWGAAEEPEQNDDKPNEIVQEQNNDQQREADQQEIAHELSNEITESRESSSKVDPSHDELNVQISNHVNEEEKITNSNEPANQSQINNNDIVCNQVSSVLNNDNEVEPVGYESVQNEEQRENEPVESESYSPPGKESALNLYDANDAVNTSFAIMESDIMDVPKLPPSTERELGAETMETSKHIDMFSQEEPTSSELPDNVRSPQLSDVEGKEILEAA